MITISELRCVCTNETIAVTQHANKRFQERGINIDDIKHAISTGEVIRQYEDDKPFPSCLLLGKGLNGVYIHLVASIDSGFLYIITAYYPDETEWESDFKTRKGY